jgi:hypothetical protein
VQDSVTWSTDVTQRGGYAVLWGTFGTGNTVYFVQPRLGGNMGSFTEVAVTPSYQSGNQINAPVPWSLQPSSSKGPVWIYLRDSAGRRTGFVPILVQ